jgi:hypothetical protein
MDPPRRAAAERLVIFPKGTLLGLEYIVTATVRATQLVSTFGDLPWQDGYKLDKSDRRPSDEWLESMVKPRGPTNACSYASVRAKLEDLPVHGGA